MRMLPKPYFWEQFFHTWTMWMIYSLAYQTQTTKKLQHVQNIAAKLVMKKAKTDSATDCLKTLYWLPIKYWIKHRIATLVYKSLHQLAPQYLQDLIKLEINNYGRSMRSTNNYKALHIPRVKRKTFTNRSFSKQGPKLWNMLPNEIRNAKTVEEFKKKLKTYYCKEAFTQQSKQ